MIRIAGVKIRELLVSEAGLHGSSFNPGQIWNLNVLYIKKLKFFTYTTVPLFLFTLYLVVYVENVSRLLRRIYNIVCYNLVVLSCRKKIGVIEDNAKCRHPKNLQVKGLCSRCFSVWGPEPHTPPIQYTYSHRKGGRGKSWTREKVREATVHKAGSKIPTWLTVSSVYKLW